MSDALPDITPAEAAAYLRTVASMLDHGDVFQQSRASYYCAIAALIERLANFADVWEHAETDKEVAEAFALLNQPDNGEV